MDIWCVSVQRSREKREADYMTFFLGYFTFFFFTLGATLAGRGKVGHPAGTDRHFLTYVLLNSFILFFFFDLASQFRLVLPSLHGNP